MYDITTLRSIPATHALIGEVASSCMQWQVFFTPEEGDQLREALWANPQRAGFKPAMDAIRRINEVEAFIVKLVEVRARELAKHFGSWKNLYSDPEYVLSVLRKGNFEAKAGMIEEIDEFRQRAIRRDHRVTQFAASVNAPEVPRPPWLNKPMDTDSPSEEPATPQPRPKSKKQRRKDAAAARREALV